MDAGESGRKKAGASEREDLPGVAEDDGVEGGDEAEEPEPHEHAEPSASCADGDLHCLRERIVAVGERVPVGDGAGKDHDAEGEDEQGSHAGDVGDGDGSVGGAHLFGGHGDALNGEEEPDGEGYRGEHPCDGVRSEMRVTSPAVDEEVAPVRAVRDDGHEDEELADGEHGDDEFEAGRDLHADDVERA